MSFDGGDMERRPAVPILLIEVETKGEPAPTRRRTNVFQYGVVAGGVFEAEKRGTGGELRNFA